MVDLGLVFEVVLVGVKVFLVTFALFLAPVPLTWMERKVAGHIQVRLGPFRVGFHGLLQSIADTIKMFFKEDVTPDRADKWLFKIAPIMALAPMAAVFIVIPFGDDVTILGENVTLYAADMNVAVLYVLAISGLAVYGIIYGGWASNSKYALLGGMRAAAQMISYEVAMSFAVVGVVMLTNTLSLVEMVKIQSGSIFDWNILYLPYGVPVGLIWFVIFLISGMAEMNRIPFDLVEDEGSLAAGFHVEYSAMRFAFFSLAEYLAMISISVLSVVLFFGGWGDPTGGHLSFLPPIVIFLAKTFFFIYFFMWTRFTFPRYRYDQLMDIGWKVLIPLSLVMILVTGVFRIMSVNA